MTIPSNNYNAWVRGSIPEGQNISIRMIGPDAIRPSSTWEVNITVNFKFRMKTTLLMGGWIW